MTIEQYKEAVEWLNETRSKCPHTDEQLTLEIAKAMIRFIMTGGEPNMAQLYMYMDICIRRYEAANPVDQRNVEIPVTA